MSFILSGPSSTETTATGHFAAICLVFAAVYTRWAPEFNAGFGRESSIRRGAGAGAARLGY